MVSNRETEWLTIEREMGRVVNNRQRWTGWSTTEMDRVVNNRKIWTGWSATDALEGVEQTIRVVRLLLGWGTDRETGWSATDAG